MKVQKGIDGVQEKVRTVRDGTGEVQIEMSGVLKKVRVTPTKNGVVQIQTDVVHAEKEGGRIGIGVRLGRDGQDGLVRIGTGVISTNSEEVFEALKKA